LQSNSNEESCESAALVIDLQSTCFVSISMCDAKIWGLANPRCGHEQKRLLIITTRFSLDEGIIV